MEVREQDKLAYTLPEVASLTGLSLSYVYRLSAENKLPVSKIGARALVLRSELEKYLRANSRGSGENRKRNRNRCKHRTGIRG